MIKRFFAVFFLNETYEITYSMEIFRLVFIQLLYWPYIAFQKFIPFQSNATSILIIIMMTIVFSIAGFFSCGRLIQIKTNKKESLIITNNQLNRIVKNYSDKVIVINTTRQYIFIYPNKNELKEFQDPILLIKIGKGLLSDKKKLRAIIKDK